jgi:F-box-like
VKRIDVLPDDVLLEIFDLYLYVNPVVFGLYLDMTNFPNTAWESLVHVCRRWRTIVFGSPRRLDLGLYCTPKTPARDTLDIWPPLPLFINGTMDLASRTENITAALGHCNRVRQITLWQIRDWQLEEVLAAMHVPFPELTLLDFTSYGEAQPIIPDSFLERSAPHLQIFKLSGIPFPGLPKLLLSAPHLVELQLNGIPHSGYFSPEAIVALISVLSSLKALSLKFQSPQSRPDRETLRLPPSKRSVIPALTSFDFKGAIEYLEDLVTRIDTPQLDDMDITFFNQIDFDTRRLSQFINRTPTLSAPEARVLFDDNFTCFELSRGPKTLAIRILCREPDWQLSSVEQVCNSSLPSLSTVEDLYIDHGYSPPVWKNNTIENTLWLQLLLPFTAVKNLYLSKEFAPGIADALQELVGITGVLSSLDNIFVEALETLGPSQENIGQFVAARQLSDHTIAISDWDGRRP